VTETKLVLVGAIGSFIVIQCLTTNLSDIYSPRVRSQGLPDGQSLTHNEDRLSVPPPSQPPNRQPQSSTGKLAYVIFGDQTTGVYYNWCSFSSLSITVKLTLLLGMHVATS